MYNVKTYQDPGDVRLPSAYPIIWLASWYPSRTSPVNGDFIQRHAEALARFLPLLVIHTIHDADLAHEVSYEMRSRGNLTEIILYFRHSGVVDSVPSKLQYNLKFHRYTKDLLRSLFLKYEKPKALHVHVPMKMGRIANWVQNKWGIPFLLSEHSSKYIGDGPDHFNRRSWLYRSGVKRIFTKALAVTNVSNAIAQVLAINFGRKDIEIIRNVVDTNLFHYMGRVANKPIRFLHASTLTEQKNFSGILKVFSDLYTIRQDFELVVLGGERDERYNAFQSAAWLNWVGTVDHHAVADYMGQSDALVLFSWNENFPCVIIEALCAGMVVISSDVGGCAEAINTENGIMVPPGDEIALYNTVNMLIDHFGRYNREQISKTAALNFSFEKIGSDFLNLYRRKGLIS